ncbi:putative transcriptional regulator [Geomicrobium halophilum]|uniref:Putative transcriptional regulator n=1 Tax=Geomicrobium halophilum TaxID=549000 RepID=A0A841PRK9_9BACL|nr:helix-turn-helix domain-containing protein [Geomicrobium halophilum]MBB6451419.1 putative transcriptional regulator [Geomicrobium halophilum]
MTATLSNADLSTYKSLSLFTSIVELNKAIRIHLYAHKHELAESAVAVFKMITNHAMKAVGVAFLKYEAIATQIDVSVSTVKRAIRVLKERNMIEVHRTTRRRGKVRGGYGHNVFVVVDPSTDRSEMNDRQELTNPDAANVQPEQKHTESLPSESSSLLEKKTSSTRKAAAGEQLDSSFVPAHVPHPFVIAAKPFFNANGIYKLWGRAVNAYKRAYIDANLTDHDVVQSLVEAFKGAMFMKKTGRLRRSLAGYFYGSCVRIFDRIFSEEIVEMKQQLGLKDTDDDLPGWLLNRDIGADKRPDFHC